MAPSLTLIPARIAILVVTLLTSFAGKVGADAYVSWMKQPAANSAGAMSDDSEWLDEAALGLQRGFVLHKAKAESASGGADASGLVQPAYNSARAMFDGPGIDGEWLDGATLGLQRGFVVHKAKAASAGARAEKPKPEPKEPAVNSAGAMRDELGIDSDWLDGTTLGLQRGFVLRKAEAKSAGARTEQPKLKQLAADFAATSDELSVGRDWLDGTTLGLQRSIVLRKAKAKSVKTRVEEAKPKQSGTFADLPRANELAKNVPPRQGSGSLAANSTRVMLDEVGVDPEWLRGATLGLQRSFALRRTTASSNADVAATASKKTQAPMVSRRVALGVLPKPLFPKNLTTQARGNISAFQGAVPMSSLIV